MLMFDLALFISLAILILGGIENQFVLLPIAFVFGGVAVQAIFLRRVRVSSGHQLPFLLIRRKTTAAAETKLCPYCNRAISAHVGICRFCLSEVEGDRAIYR